MTGAIFLAEWELDGTIGLIFTLLTVAAGAVYLLAAEVGRRRDRRGRHWPVARTVCFVGGLAVLLVAIDSGIGAGADEHLSDHMVEHMLIWLAAAPLLVAGAPVRLALFAFGTWGRRRLGSALRSRPIVVLTGPAFSTALFSAIVVGTMVPAIFDLTLEDDLVHVGEHALYLLTATLVWAPLIGADPVPHRIGAAGRCLCVLACMIPMAALSVWLLAAGAPLYRPYEEAIGAAAALHDQRLAGLVMLAAGIPALALALAAPLAALRDGTPRPRVATRT